MKFPQMFDLVVCREVIEHMKRKEGIMLLERINKVLKPDGILIISTPNKSSPEGIFSRLSCKIMGKEWNAWDPSHQYIYSSNEFKNILKNYFIIKEVRGEYYLFNIFEYISETVPLLFPLLKKFRAFNDKILGLRYPTNSYGFVIEYLVKNKTD